MGRFAGSIVACVMAVGAMGTALPAFAEPLNYAGLRAMVEGMGYETKTLTDSGEQSLFEVTLSAGGFDIPVAFEVSKSTRYVWVRANLGKQPLTGEDGLALLRKTSEIQPAFFWVTSSGLLYLGMAVDNREITPAHMRFVMEKVVNDVANTAEAWSKPAPE